MSVISKTPIRFQFTPLDGNAHEVNDPESWLRDKFNIVFNEEKQQKLEALTTKIANYKDEKIIKPEIKNQNIAAPIAIVAANHPIVEDAKLLADLHNVVVNDSYEIQNLNDVLKKYNDETKKQVARKIAKDAMNVIRNCNVDYDFYSIVFYMSLIATIKNEPNLLGDVIIDINSYAMILSEVNQKNDMINLIVDEFNRL